MHTVKSIYICISSKAKNVKKRKLLHNALYSRAGVNCAGLDLSLKHPTCLATLIQQNNLSVDDYTCIHTCIYIYIYIYIKTDNI